MDGDYEAADHLAQLLRRSLNNAGIVPAGLYPARGWPALRVNGGLDLGQGGVRLEAEAACSVVITRDWRAVPPRVWCISAWSLALQRTKSPGDWHFNSDGSLCYVLDAEWMDTVSGPEAVEIEETGEAAVFFLLRNLRYLLIRHLIAYHSGLQAWPAEWAEWPHGPLGPQAYRREREVCGKQS